jgi:protein-tyrosine-phosphatase
MNILYVCTGNIFRSMSAEYITKHYIKDHHIPNISVSSAGTRARPEQPFPRTVKKLASYWIDASAHQQTKISPELLAKQDLIICMAEHHRQSIRELWYDAVLFNEIAYEKSEDVLDDAEYMNQYGPHFDLESYVYSIVEYIHDAIPNVVKNILQKQT